MNTEHLIRCQDYHYEISRLCSINIKKEQQLFGSLAPCRGVLALACPFFEAMALLRALLPMIKFLFVVVCLPPRARVIAGSKDDARYQPLRNIR